MERFRWWFADIRDAVDRWWDLRLAGALAVVALLAGGGYIVADMVSQAGAGTTTSHHLVRLVTTVREPVKLRVHGRTVVRWRTRRKVVEAQAQTVMQTRTVQTPGGTKVIRRPVVRYRVVYHKRVVTRNGKTRTVVSSRTVTNSQTNTLMRTQTEVHTVTQPVTVVQTRTVVTTQTLPGTTVTLPGATVTVTVPGG